MLWTCAWLLAAEESILCLVGCAAFVTYCLVFSSVVTSSWNCSSVFIGFLFPWLNKDLKFFFLIYIYILLLSKLSFFDFVSFLFLSFCFLPNYVNYSSPSINMIISQSHCKHWCYIYILNILKVFTNIIEYSI